MKTIRGFGISKFKDAYGFNCSIQESSACGEEGKIWLGVDDEFFSVMVPGDGWKKVNIQDLYPGQTVISHGRMHLTQTQVKTLLPALEYFAEYGLLPEGI